jgi:hypothetical protein
MRLRGARLSGGGKTARSHIGLKVAAQIEHSAADLCEYGPFASRSLAGQSVWRLIEKDSRFVGGEHVVFVQWTLLWVVLRSNPISAVFLSSLKQNDVRQKFQFVRATFVT